MLGTPLGPSENGYKKLVPRRAQRSNLGEGATEIIEEPEVLKHYKNLLDVEHAFEQFKSYLKVHPVFHDQPDCIRNHMRICFLAYYLMARLSREWKTKKVTTEVAEVLRQLQCIRVGYLSVKNKIGKKLFTKIPKELNSLLHDLEMLNLFSSVPEWTSGYL